MATGIQLAELAKTRVGLHYVKGGQGLPLTKSTLAWLRARYGTAPYVLCDAWIGLQVFDCSGLVTWCLIQLGANVDKHSHNPEWYIHNTVKVNFADLQPGDLCFMLDEKNNAYHVGVYFGEGYVVHASGVKVGVVFTRNVSSWDAFGRIKHLEQPVSDPTVMTVLSFGSRGEEVKKLQALLNGHGASPKLEVDGIFGPLTETEVKDFQRVKGLPATGAVDTQTWEALRQPPEWPHTVHVFKDGETLWSIARKAGVPWKSIRPAGGKPSDLPMDQYNVHAGDVLWVPVK